MPRVSTKHLTPREYETLMTFYPSMTDEHKQVIYEAMVEKKQQAELATKYDMSRQAVNQIIDRIWKKYQTWLKFQNSARDIKDLPNGWITMQVAAPDFMMDKFVNEVREYAAINNIQYEVVKLVSKEQLD